VPYRHVNIRPYRHVNRWILDTGYSIVVSGSLVNLAKLDNMVKWLRSNLDPRLRHSRTSLAVLRYITDACWRVSLAFWLTGGYYTIKHVKFQVNS
jgi:hypothetical protein